MTIAFRASSAASVDSGFTGASTQALTLSSSIVAGDLVLVAVNAGSGTVQPSLSASGGGVTWNTINATAGGGSGFGTLIQLTIFWALAVSGTVGASITATNSASTDATWQMASASWSGALRVETSASLGATGSSGVTTLTEPSVTTTNSDDWLVGILGLYAISTATISPTAPTDTSTSRSTVGTPDFYYCGIFDSNASVAAGSHGGGSWSWTGASDGAAVLLALSDTMPAGASLSDSVPGQAIPGFIPGTTPAVSSTPVSSSDTGSGADAGESIHASFTSTDAASGSDSPTAIKVVPAAGDTGSVDPSAGEQGSVKLPVSSSDASNLTVDAGEKIKFSAADASNLTVDAGEKIKLSASDASSLTVDAGESVHATFSSADASILTVDAGEQIHATLSSADASSQAVDGGEQIHATLSSADVSSQTVDAGESIHATLSSADTGSVDPSTGEHGLVVEGAISSDASSLTVDAGEQIHATLSSSDSSSLTVDAGEKIKFSAADASSLTVDAGEQIHATFTSADTGHGTDAGEQVNAAVTSADTGHGTDAGESIHATLSSADSGHGADAGESIHAALSSADSSSQAVDNGSVSSGFPVSSADSGHFQDSEIVYYADSDTGSAAENAYLAFSTADSATAAEAGSIAVTGTVYLSSADSASALDAASVAGTGTQDISSADTASAADAGPAYPLAVSSADSASAAENLWEHTGTGVPQSGIDVWTTIPDYLFLRGGDGLYNVVWHKGQPGEVVVLCGVPLSRALLEFAAELERTDTLTLLSDTDAGTAADAQTPLATVRAVVLAPAVMVGIPGRVGAPGQFGSI